VKVVTESDAVHRLVSICPDFQDIWRQHLNRYHDEGEYIHIGVLAEWVVDRVASGELRCLPDLFTEVETILEEASDDVRNLLVIGLLEDVQLFAMGKLTPKAETFDPDVVLGLLGPQARQEWFGLIARYWDRYEPGRWRWQHTDAG
jgi:hypothetical protein